MNKVFYEQDLINPGVWDDIFKESDEIIAAASHANGINMSPLFHQVETGVEKTFSKVVKRD